MGFKSLKDNPHEQRLPGFCSTLPAAPPLRLQGARGEQLILRGTRAVRRPATAMVLKSGEPNEKHVDHLVFSGKYLAFQTIPKGHTTNTLKQASYRTYR